MIELLRSRAAAEIFLRTRLETLERGATILVGAILGGGVRVKHKVAGRRHLQRRRRRGAKHT